MANRTARAINYQALADFRYEIRRFLNSSERAARAARIEPQQHQALLAIKALPAESEATIGALAERLQIKHHSAVELAGRLQARGWIRRTRSPADRREVLLELTCRGEGLLKDLSLSHHNELHKAGPRLIEALRSVIARGELAPSPRPPFLGGLRRGSKPQRRRGSR
ncbi:MAG: MarR family transcriptional regulator [Candidatus Acidiferrales bacterium]|jgi:DNA-binding MarR family transcriptional regulator